MPTCPGVPESQSCADGAAPPDYWSMAVLRYENVRHRSMECGVFYPSCESSNGSPGVPDLYWPKSMTRDPRVAVPCTARTLSDIAIQGQLWSKQPLFPE